MQEDEFVAVGAGNGGVRHVNEKNLRTFLVTDTGRIKTIYYQVNNIPDCLHVERVTQAGSIGGRVTHLGKPTVSKAYMRMGWTLLEDHFTEWKPELWDHFLGWADAAALGQANLDDLKNAGLVPPTVRALEKAAPSANRWVPPNLEDVALPADDSPPKKGNDLPPAAGEIKPKAEAKPKAAKKTGGKKVGASKLPGAK